MMDPREQKICGCGTVGDAIKVAEKLYIDAAAADCSIWALQVASAFAIIANHVMKKEAGMSQADLTQIALFIGTATIDGLDLNSIADQVAARTARINNRSN